MDYVDATLVQLANDATRTALFDQATLEHLIVAAYRTDLFELQGPYQPIFDDVRLGYAVPTVATIEGVWGNISGMDQSNGRFHVRGLGPSVRIDAIWQGGIIARTIPANSRVIDVAAQFTDFQTIDPAIAAALGALPGDPDVLEQERRAELLRRIRAPLTQDASFPDHAFEDWLARTGFTSVSALLEHAASGPFLGTLSITYSAPDPAIQPTPRLLPLTAAILVRDAGFSISQLLSESKIAREHLETLGLEPAGVTEYPRRNPITFAWVVPARLFDDADWPGADSAARRQNARQWLAREGIGLVVTANP